MSELQFRAPKLNQRDQYVGEGAIRIPKRIAAIFFFFEQPAAIPTENSVREAY